MYDFFVGVKLFFHNKNLDCSKNVMMRILGSNREEMGKGFEKIHNN
jgi:hypothetical protein